MITFFNDSDKAEEEAKKLSNESGGYYARSSISCLCYSRSKCFLVFSKERIRLKILIICLKCFNNTLV